MGSGDVYKRQMTVVPVELLAESLVAFGKLPDLPMAAMMDAALLTGDFRTVRTAGVCFTSRASSTLGASPRWHARSSVASNAFEEMAAKPLFLLIVPMRAAHLNLPVLKFRAGGASLSPQLTTYHSTRGSLNSYRPYGNRPKTGVFQPFG